MELFNQWHYIFEFTDAERAKIQAETRLLTHRAGYGILVGVITTLAVFLSQWPWMGEPHLIHGYATYGSLPAGLVVGLLTPHWITWHCYKRWRDVWTPLARSRRELKGLETQPPTRPATLIEMVDRRVIKLTPGNCTALLMFGFLAIAMILGPILMLNPITRALAALFLLCSFFISLLLGDRLGRH
jgi:hypothetical protein